MIEGLSEEKVDTTEEQEEVEVELATIVSVGASGLVLKFDGEDEAREKDYKCNAGVRFAAGDRVKIHKMSGTYVVEYAIGNPNSAVPWGLPSGGGINQVLRRTQTGAEWSDETKELPSDGSAGQVLKRTSSGTQWANEKTELPSGGSSGQVLTKQSNGGAAWANVPSPTIPTPAQIKKGSYYMQMGSAGELSTNCQRLGFFGATPSSKKFLYSSATLTDVINLLKAYGLA